MILLNPAVSSLDLAAATDYSLQLGEDFSNFTCRTQCFSDFSSTTLLVVPSLPAFLFIPNFLRWRNLVLSPWPLSISISITPLVISFTSLKIPLHQNKKFRLLFITAYSVIFSCMSERHLKFSILKTEFLSFLENASLSN